MSYSAAVVAGVGLACAVVGISGTLGVLWLVSRNEAALTEAATEAALCEPDRRFDLPKDPVLKRKKIEDNLYRNVIMSIDEYFLPRTDSESGQVQQLHQTLGIAI